MKKLLRLFFCPFLFLVLLTSCTPDQDKPYVVMLSLDGFRWDYTDSVATPNFDYLAEHGVKAASLKPSFPTKTFPNHYSIATGLYPDHHGIVANSFYDKTSGRKYRLSDREAVEDGYFYGGEPIWVTAEKQGLTAASYFWVGSEAPIQDIHPTYWKKYDHDFPFAQSIDSVISWLKLPEEKRPQLVLFYNSEPDGMGHHEGPEATTMKEKIIYLDSLVGVFLEKSRQLSIADNLNFILVSDHGMTALDSSRVIYLSDYIHPDWFERIEGYNPVYFFQPLPEYEDSARIAFQAMEHATVWHKDSLPSKWHYGTNHDRIEDYVLVADNGWQVRFNHQSRLSNGDHGYDNDFKDMHGIFYAMGPAFKEAYLHPTFENVHIYNLISHILHLAPAPNDGKLETVKKVLK